MSVTPKILAFAGSARRDSFNKKLLRLAAEAARAGGADVTLIDLRDYPMPIYDGDLEQASGLPDNAIKVKHLMRSHHGFLVAAPEYNGSLTPLIKNTIDWASRAESSDEPPLECYRGKTGALISASPGRLGGMRGLVPLRALFSHLGVTLVTGQFSLSSAGRAFDDEGRLREDRDADRLRAVVEALVDLTRRIAG